MSFRFRWLISILFVSLVLVGCADVPGAEASGSSESAQTDTTAAKTAVQDLKNATDKKDEVDARLGRVVGRVGGLLTATQQANVVKAFNGLPDVVTIEQNYRTKADALAAELDKVAADPEAIATFKPRRLLDGYALIAKTPAATSAVTFGNAVLAKRITLAGVSDDEVMEQVLGPAIAFAYMHALISSGSTERASQQMIAYFSAAVGQARKIAGWFQKYNALTESDILAETCGISSKAANESLRTIAGIISIWKLGDDALAGDPYKLLQDFFTSAPNAVSGVAQGVAMFRRFVMGVEKTPIADAVIKWSGKIATVIGIVTNGLALLHDAGKWNDSMDAKLRVISDVLSIGACILVLVATGPVGPIVATIAVGLSFFADWLEGQRLQAQEAADVKACLPAAALGATLTQTILDSEPALLKVLTNDVKLGPSDMQWLLTKDPLVASVDAGMPLQFIGMRIAQKIFDLDAKETGELLHAALGDVTNPDDAAMQLDAFFRAWDFGYVRGDMTRDEAMSWMKNDAVMPGLDANRAALLTAAMTGAEAYLATVP